MSNNDTNRPFQPLGKQLKSMREKRRESLSEVSGAVEIDPDVLSRFEEGLDRPTEDILLLLISHFASKEDTAAKLWHLAGYDKDELPMQNISNDTNNQIQNGIVLMPTDAKIVYTDMVHVMVNNYGVVLNFMQTSGPGNQPMAVSRVGMSREHAQSVLEVLKQTLSLQSQNILPSENQKHSKQNPDQKSK